MSERSRHLALFSLAPLRSPLFRRYLLAASLMNICLWTYLTGLSWTILERTGSAATVSLVQTLMTVPLAFMMVPAGVLTDRLGSRRLMRVAYLGYTSGVGLTAMLVLGDSFPLLPVLAIAFALGCFDSLNVVAAPVFVGRTVAPADMGAAIGLSLLSSGFGRIAGGPLGGAIVSTFGPSAALIPAAVTLLVAFFVVWTLPSLSGSTSSVGWRRADVTAAFTWARKTPVARLVILLGATTAFLVSGYTPLIPIATRQLIGGSGTDLGLLTAAGGIGMLVTAFVIDTMGRRVGRVRTAIGALLVSAGLIAAMGASHSFPVTALIVALLAGSVATYSATANMLLQSSAPGSLRGRAVGLYGVVFFTLQPIGIVGLGVLADQVGVGAVLFGMAAATVVTIGVIVAGNRAIWPALAGREVREPGVSAANVDAVAGT